MSGVCDANYNFILYDVGSYGSMNDAAVLNASNISKRVRDGTMGIPKSNILPNSTTVLPLKFIADKGFPLNQWILRPYQGNINVDYKKYFNAKLGRSRRIIENTFALLCARWRVLLGTIQYPTLAPGIVRATLCLHNLVNKFSTDDIDAILNYSPEDNILYNISHSSRNLSSSSHTKQRDDFAVYMYANKL